MLVRFTRRADNGTVAEFTRRDGVRLRLHSYDRTGLVPHDAAHLVVERAFHLSRGLWGCLSGGALFDSVELIEGRTRHDHKARSVALRKQHDGDLRLAEQVVGAALSALGQETHDLPRHLASVWSIYRNGPPPDAKVGLAALAGLTELKGRWDRVQPGTTFELDWPG